MDFLCDLSHCSPPGLNSPSLVNELISFLSLIVSSITIALEYSPCRNKCNGDIPLCLPLRSLLCLPLPLLFSGFGDSMLCPPVLPINLVDVGEKVIESKAGAIYPCNCNPHLLHWDAAVLFPSAKHMILDWKHLLVHKQLEYHILTLLGAR